MTRFPQSLQNEARIGLLVDFSHAYGAPFKSKKYVTNLDILDSFK
jgi:hypothetical protein